MGESNSLEKPMSLTVKSIMKWVNGFLFSSVFIWVWGWLPTFLPQTYSNECVFPKDQDVNQKKSILSQFLILSSLNRDEKEPEAVRWSA
jgi:hypothetical protein